MVVLCASTVVVVMGDVCVLLPIDVHLKLQAVTAAIRHRIRSLRVYTGQDFLLCGSAADIPRFE